MRADCRICDPSAGVVEISRTSRGTAIALSDRLGDDVSSSSRDWRVTMSEERFDRIDQALAHVGAGLENVNHNMHVLHDDVNGLHDNVRGLHDDVHVLRHDMHVLHEDALSRIAAVAESVVVLDQKMERGFAEVKETIRAEIVPLKAAVRHHATEIEKLKNARG
jgi:archaellum component FlaC